MIKCLRLIHKGEVVAEVPADALAEDAPVYHKPSSRTCLLSVNSKQMNMEVPQVDRLWKKHL